MTFQTNPNSELQPPEIDLECALLRPLRVTDADALYEYLCDPAVTDRTSYPEVSLPMARAMIERCRSRWAVGEPSKWGLALPDDGRLVGTCGFNEWSRDHRWAELAFDLARSQWGRGLMRQAVTAVLQWACQPGRLRRIHAYVQVDNLRSQRLLERCGFSHEGCLKSFRVCRGEPKDFHVYGLLLSDWAPKQHD